LKALVLTAYNQLEYKEVPDPEVGPEDVLVQVKACGICGSDVHGMDGSTGRRLPPVIMGHEAAGVVAGVGSKVTGWEQGDRVTFDSTIYCGECFFCRRGETNLCDDRRVLGVSCEEYRQDGAFADYVAVPARTLYRLPDGLSFERATFVEPLSVAAHAVSQAPRGPEDTALLVGAGVIGLLVIQVLRSGACGRIIAVDLDQGRLELARRVGADHAFNPEREDAVGEVLELTARRGVDIAFEVVGIAPTVKTAVQCLRKGGVLTLVGNLAPTVEVPLQDVVTRELSLKGTYCSVGDYPACLDMISSGTVDVDPLTSAVAPLADGASWFNRLHAREAGLIKVILQP
jgi:threonine dehydrogenase-like Zn-dependent dehydrogenase